MAPGFELMGWLKEAGAQAALPAEGTALPAQLATPAAPATASPAAPTASAASGVTAPVRIAAPHSQAAAALAAALSGGVPEKKHPQLHGFQISPLQEVLEVDRSRPESSSAMVVSKIANVKSEISRRHGHAIAVDANYICYGLKGGQIRILNRHTGARTLLKDHAAPVTDLRLFRHDSERCLLASVDTTGQVHVRKVYEEDTGGEDTVRDEILARHELPIPVSGPAAHPTGHLAWHPTYDFVLAVAVGDTVYLINVPPTADVAAAPEYAAPVAAARSADGTTMTSVAFSPAGDLLAAGDEHGYVYVWALTPEQLDPALIQPLALEPDIRFQAYGSAPGEAPYGDGAGALAAVASLHWLPRAGGDAGERGSAGGGEGSNGGGGGPLALLTGDGVNAHLKLWTIDLSSKPHCTHAIRLVSGSAAAAAAPFFNHLEAQPLYDCVVLANELRSHVYVLHVDLATQPDAPSFDYLSEFSVKMPILSCTLVPEAFVDESTDAEAFHMYTIQSDAVQQYTLVPSQCFPMPAPPAAGAAAGTAAGSSAVSGAAAGSSGHYHILHGASASSTAAADAASAARLARDPLAALLALQHEKERERVLQEAAPVLHGTAAPTASPPPPPPPSMLVSAPSDVSDATSPLMPLAAAPAAAATVSSAAAAAAAHAYKESVDTAVAAAAAAAAAAEEEEENMMLGSAAEAEVAALVADAVEEVAPAQQPEAQPAAEAQPPAPTSGGSRQSLLLTPSQLMQSAAAAAAARSVAGSSIVSAGGGAPAEDVYGVISAGGGGDNDTAASTAGTSRTHSLVLTSNMTPCLSDANLAAATAEAEAEAVAVAETEELVADDAAALAAVAALPATGAAAAGSQQSPMSMPPLPSEQLVRRISQGKNSIPLPPHVALAQRPQSASPPLASPSAAAALAAAAAKEESRVVTATPLAASGPPAATLDLQSQQQLAQLLALQQQLLEQVSSGQRELLKAVRTEAQRGTKAAADAAASRAVEVVARKAAEERRKEGHDLQKALTAVINNVAQDISQRIADAAAATTAAVKASIGPAVRAAVAEALPAALSAGATAAALERALGSQLAASLPRAVADGLGAAFTAQVVPPLERATSTMFGQMEAALRTGLDAHLTPLTPLAGLGSQLRDAAAQVQTAAKSLKTEATAVQQAVATASRAATAAAGSAATAAASSAAAAAAAPAAPANSNAKGGGAKAPQPAAAAPTAAPAVAGGASRSTAADTAAAAAATAAAAAASKPALSVPAPSRQQPPAPLAPPPSASSSFSVSAPSSSAAAAPPQMAVPAAAPTSLPPAVDPATRDLVLSLLRTGDLDGALSRVLERQDLQLVLWACTAAGGAAVLAVEPCPLGQATLLSLLTFLSYDLTADVDVKLGWIDAILKRLDVREPGLEPHIRGVLDSVKGALAVIARGGTGATAAKAKQAVHQAIGLIAMLS